MSKLNNDQRMEIYYKRKQGMTLSALSKEYGINKRNLEYMIQLLDRHGSQSLRQGKNRYYPPSLKLEMINKVLIDHQSMNEISLEYGLIGKSMLSNWIRSYRENGYAIVEKKRGRCPAMKKPVKPVDPNDKDAIIRQKDEEILKLRAENEYLKKLRAVVQERMDRQSKKK